MIHEHEMKELLARLERKTISGKKFSFLDFTINKYNIYKAALSPPLLLIVNI